MTCANYTHSTAVHSGVKPPHPRPCLRVSCSCRAYTRGQADPQDTSESRKPAATEPAATRER